MLDVTIKNNHLESLAKYRQKLMTEPQLKHLFLELTLRCNENCIHCGSRCGEIRSEELSVQQYETFLKEV